MRLLTLQLRSALSQGVAGMLAALVLTLVAVPSHASEKAKAPLMSVPEQVRDLYYGDALFYFFQEKFFDALVRLDAAINMGRIEHHKTEAELVRGELYLQMADYVDAARIFHELLNDNVSDDVRNHCWFLLGKIFFQRGYYDEAEKALGSIKGTLSDRLEPERHMLMAEILLSERRFDEAITALEAMDKTKLDKKKDMEVTDSWSMYARFNLGVALVRENRMDEAIKLLETVGQMKVGSDELAGLRDKANLALGFTLLKLQRPGEAQTALERIRMIGPLSNKALLGLGWAESSQGQFNAALVPWMELQKRNLLDPAVQESLLAVPYAYAQLKSEGQAAEFYSSAIQSFEQESARIDQSINSIQGGGLIATVLANETQSQGRQEGWYWQLRNLPDAPETRYLYDLLASNTFQEALKNFRDLKAMRSNLEEWLQNLDAFQDMVDTRKIAYEQRVAAMKKVLDDVDMDGIENKVLDFDSRLKEIERNDDVVALATSAEQEQWHRVNRVKDALAMNPGTDADTAEMQDKIRLMRGVLYWNMSASFKARLWREKKELRELAVATTEARRRYTLVGRARDTVPKRNAEFSQRVKDLEPKLQALLGRCLDADQAQSDYLAKLAVTQLQEQKDRLAQYTLQAQYALASIYDRAADGQKAAKQSSSDTAGQGNGSGNDETSGDSANPAVDTSSNDGGTETNAAPENTPTANDAAEGKESPEGGGDVSPADHSTSTKDDNKTTPSTPGGVQ